jgi:hypothetical protein
MAPLNGLAQATFLASLAGGQQCANTFAIFDSGGGVPPDPGELEDLANDLNDYFATTYRAILRTVDTFDAIKVAQVPDPTISGDPYADFLLPLDLAGTRTAGDGNAPREACACVSLKTNSGQRSYRGHLLLPPSCNTSSLAGESFATGEAYYQACEAFRDQLLTGAGNTPTWTGSALSSYRLSIYSRTLHAAGQPSITGVVAVVANTRVHWLRSRARGTT